MKLIADSGSTKTEWILLDNNKEVLHLETVGLNPYFIDDLIIKKAIVYSELRDYRENVNEVEFYGAGCSNTKKAAWLKDKLAFHFTKAEITINTDIKAAVLAVSNNKPCTVCILGTGSTFRLFDGENIIKKYSSLSYILGDEGSGTDIAKALLRGVFYENFSQKTIDLFFKDYAIDSEILLDKVYKEPLPNRYLASFVPFCKKHIHIPEVERIVLDAFEHFYLEHLQKFDYPHKYPVHFVGSIAFYFEEQLKQVANKYSFNVGTIIKNPLPKLAEIHSK